MLNTDSSDVAVALKTLRAVRETVSSAQEPDALIDAVCRVIVSAYSVHAAWALLFDTDPDGIRSVYASCEFGGPEGYDELVHAVTRDPPPTCIAEALALGEPVEAHRETCAGNSYLEALSAVSGGLVVRLECRGHVIGLLSMWQAGGRDTGEEGRMLAAEIAAVVAGEVYRTSLERERAILRRRLSRRSQDYKRMFETAPVGIYQTSQDGRPLVANPQMCRILGYRDEQELIYQLGDLAKQLYVQPGRRDELLTLLKRDGVVRNFEFAAYRKDGAVAHLLTNARLAQAAPKVPAVIFGFLEDITDRHSRALELERAVKRAGVLVQEVHHRVGNNLSVVMSLMNLQRSRINSPEDVLTAFDNTCERIRSIAVVHQLVLKSIADNTISLADLVHELVGRRLASELDPTAHRIECPPEIAVNLDAAVPVALMVEELTHGEFAGVRIGPECRVELTIAQTESGGVRLVFQAELIDEHRWIDPPEGTDFSDIMVGALAEQVDADLEVERRGPGEPRRCIISLPPEVQQPSRLIHGPDELDDWSEMGAM